MAALCRGGRGRRLAGPGAVVRPGQRDRARRRTPTGPARSCSPAAAPPPRSRSPNPARRSATTRPGSRRSATPSARTAGSGSTPTAAGTSTSAVAAIRALDRSAGGLEYVEQPCATVEELAAVRRAVDVPIAADESIRRAADPYRVRDLEAADVAVLKVQPLGGVRACLRIAEDIGLPVVVSSALETSVGIAAGVALAAALPELPYACGLATVQLLTDDVVRSLRCCRSTASCRSVVRRWTRRPSTAWPPRRSASPPGRPGWPRCGPCGRITARDEPVDRAGPRGGHGAGRGRGHRGRARAGFAERAAGVRGVRRGRGRAAPAAHADRRADRRLPRARTDQGRLAGRGDLHVRHRRRQPAPGRPRGGPRRRAARRRHRRPAGPAARHQREPDHRPRRHLRAAGADRRRRRAPPTSPTWRRTARLCTSTSSSTTRSCRQTAGLPD